MQKINQFSHLLIAFIVLGLLFFLKIPYLPLLLSTCWHNSYIHKHKRQLARYRICKTRTLDPNHNNFFFNGHCFGTYKLLSLPSDFRISNWRTAQIGSFWSTKRKHSIAIHQYCHRMDHWRFD